MIGNLVQRRRPAPYALVEDRISGDTYPIYAMALDRFRQLGAADLRENYCISMCR